mmetsp:Transcript_26075/g.44446  ORF Transcript_26075/g.44446 Transcript_26075/m.44446 type:complete len:213 (-) Transcript_26075:872-1510(-)
MFKTIFSKKSPGSSIPNVSNADDNRKKSDTNITMINATETTTPSRTTTNGAHPVDLRLPSSKHPTNVNKLSYYKSPQTVEGITGRLYDIGSSDPNQKVYTSATSVCSSASTRPGRITTTYAPLRKTGGFRWPVNSPRQSTRPPRAMEKARRGSEIYSWITKGKRKSVSMSMCTPLNRLTTMISLRKCPPRLRAKSKLPSMPKPCRTTSPRLR